jgi:hypothetical protein
VYLQHPATLAIAAVIEQTAAHLLGTQQVETPRIFGQRARASEVAAVKAYGTEADASIIVLSDLSSGSTTDKSLTQGIEECCPEVFSATEKPHENELDIPEHASHFFARITLSTYSHAQLHIRIKRIRSDEHSSGMIGHIGVPVRFWQCMSQTQGMATSTFGS